MEIKTNLESVEELIKGFDISKIDSAEPVETKPVTTWIPVDCKRKYDELQSISRGKFGKLIQKIFIKTIEDVSKTA